MTDRDRTEGDALFAAAWAEDMAEPLADWLAERLPGPAWWSSYHYRTNPRVCVVYIDAFAVSGVPDVVAVAVIAVNDRHVAAHSSRHLPRDTFALEFPAWLREAFGEVRRVRAAADRP